MSISCNTSTLIGNSAMFLGTITAWKVSKYRVFLVCIFLYSDWIPENMDQKKLRIWTLFMLCILVQLLRIILLVQIRKQLLLCIMPRYINQRETKLFHFTQDTNKVRVEGSKTRWLCNSSMLLCNGYVAFKTAVFYK